MIIFYSDDLTITGYQTFPETSNTPHIVAPDDLAELLQPVIGYAQLVAVNGVLHLPDDLPAIAESKRLSDLATEGRAERDRRLQELDAIVANPLRWGSLTSEQQQALADYRKSLLEAPQQAGFPADIVWPALPDTQNP